MSRLDKAKERIRSKPKDYTYNEAKSLLMQLGFREYTKRKTSGSRIKFYRELDTSHTLAILCQVVQLKLWLIFCLI